MKGFSVTAGASSTTTNGNSPSSPLPQWLVGAPSVPTKTMFQTPEVVDPIVELLVRIAAVIRSSQLLALANLPRNRHSSIRHNNHLHTGRGSSLGSPQCCEVERPATRPTTSLHPSGNFQQTSKMCPKLPPHSQNWLPGNKRRSFQ